MSAMEKLLVQIFERKKWIVNQAKHQTFLFEQHLASKCLIDGVAPPPWLCSSSSDPNNVLNKQELISGVPLPQTRSVIPFTGSHCSVFDKPAPTTLNRELPNGLCTELHSFDKGLGAGNIVSVLPQCPISNAGCASDGVPQDQREEDPSVTSPEDLRDSRISDIYHDPALSLARGAGDEVSVLPQYPIRNAGCYPNGVPKELREEDLSVTSPEDQRDARTSDIYHDPAMSLARVQRSRSRQKALAIRNSAKKSCSQDKKNANGYACGTVGCAISSLHSDHVGELNLVKPPDTSHNNTCEVEEAKIGEFPSTERGPAISSGRITRSRSSGQQESSLNVSFAASISRKKGCKLADSIGTSPQQSDHVNEPLELVNHSHITEDSCQEKEAKQGDHFSKEKGSSIYCGRTTRSRSASQQPNCPDKLLKLEHSSNSIREDGVSNSMQQPKHADQMVEVMNSYDIIDGSSEVKTRLGECWGKGHRTSDYCGRITRSRSSSHPPNEVNNSPKLDTSSVMVKGDGCTLKHSTGKSTQPTQPLSWTGGDPDFHDGHGLQVSVSRSLPAQNNLEFCALNGEKHSRNGNSSEDNVSRSTGSQAVRSIEKVAKDASSNVSQIIYQSTSAASNKSHVEQRTQTSAGRSVPIQKDLNLCAVNSTDSSDKENDADQYANRNTSAKINCTTEVMSKPVNSQALGHRGTQSRSAASSKHFPEQLTHEFAGIMHRDVSSTIVKEVPSTQPSEFVEAVPVGETEIDHDGFAEANPIGSGSNLDGLRVGVEVLSSRQPADCNVFVNPKQLNFDDVEESCLNGIPTPSLKSGMQGRSSEKRSLSLMQSEDILDKRMSVNYQEDYNSSLEMNFLGDQDVSLKGKELQSGLSEAPVEELYKSRSALTENAVSSIKEKADAHEDAVASPLLESGKFKESSSIDYLTGLRVTWERSVENLVEEVKGSNMSGGNAVKLTELVSEEGAVVSHAVGNPIVSTDSDFSMVSEPGSLKIPDAKNVTVDNPCAASTDETKGNLAQPIIHSHISPKYEQCSTSDNRNEGHSKSTECQIAEKFKGRSFGSSMEGSWPHHKRRKIEPKIADNLSASPGMREKGFHSVNRDSMRGKLGSVEHSPKAVLESQGLSISREDVVKSIVSRNPVEETHQNEDHHMIERPESSPESQMKEGEFSLGFGDTSGNTPFTFMHEELEASLLSSLMKQAGGHYQDCFMEETGVGNVDAGSRCIEVNNVSFPLEDNLIIGNVEHLTCAGRTVEEKRFDLQRTSKFGSPHGQSLDLIGSNDTKPELEGFVMQTDDEPTSIAGEEISFDKWILPSTTIERASILEQLCKSACMQTPVACSSASYKLHKIPNLYQSVSTELLEGVDMRTTFPMNHAVEKLKDGHSCLSEEVGQAFDERSYSDCLSNRSDQSGWDIKKPYMSPVGKLWDRSGSSTSSSGKRGSLNPELPCISEENENADEVADTFQDGIFSEVLNSSIQRVPLADINEIPNPPASVSKAEPYGDRLSLDSVNTELSLTGTHKSFKKKLGIQSSSKRRYNNKENLSILRGKNDTKRTTGSLQNRFSKPKLTSSRKGGPSLSEQEPKRNNILSSMTSFIPLVQQKQAAAVVTGKRDIKVKALETAEAAKRLAEKKENERKMKKEALKLERSRMEQENMRQLELQKKKKEEERKKKEADMAAKKRQREEEEKKERERKRMRVETRRQLREHEDKLPAEKEDKEMKCQAIDGRGKGSRESKDETTYKKIEEERGHDTFRNIAETGTSTSRVSTSNSRRESIVHEECCEALSNFDYKSEVLSNQNKAMGNKNSVANASQEQSYEISPYKESDDENEEEDDIIPNSKFIPSWSSKKCLALAVSCQKAADPETIFPPESFCNISEVLLPRMHP